MPKIVCPYCFEEFKRSEVKFRCDNDSCEATPDEMMALFWGRERRIRPTFANGLGFFGRMTDAMPASAECPKCGRMAHRVACPHCHNLLPKEMVEHKGHIISIIGARSSGKTNYITVLIDQLIRNVNNLGRIGVLANTTADDARDNTYNRYKNEFYEVLFERGLLPAQTPIESPMSKIPLIYDISKSCNEPHLYLVFYDTAGENFNDPRNIRNNVKFLDESDAVIFLLDTFSIPYVHDKLGIKEKIELKYDVILNNIVEHFANGDRDKAKRHFNIPMALAFSKIDAILQHGDEFADTAIPGMTLDQNSPYLSGGGVRMDDIDTVSEGIHAALSMWQEQNFVNNIDNRYKNVKYFGISSLGKDPGNDQTVHDIQPYRVLDPLVWILDQFKYPLPKAR